jgi:hypothetical protein
MTKSGSQGRMGIARAECATSNKLGRIWKRSMDSDCNLPAVMTRIAAFLFGRDSLEN